MTVTYDHRLRRIGHPVRSAIHKPQIGRLVVGWVTTSEYLLLYVLHFFGGGAGFCGCGRSRSSGLSVHQPFPMKQTLYPSGAEHQNLRSVFIRNSSSMAAMSVRSVAALFAVIARRQILQQQQQYALCLIQVASFLHADLLLQIYWELDRVKSYSPVASLGKAGWPFELFFLNTELSFAIVLYG